MDPNREESFRKAGVATISNDIAEHQSGIWRSLMTQREQVWERAGVGARLRAEEC